MIQYFWQIDFLGIFLSRLIVSLTFFLLGLKLKNQNKIMSILYFLTSPFIFLGFLSSFISLVWIFYLILKLIITKRLDLFEALLISFFILIVFVGPGRLSLDRIFNLRW